MSSTTARAGLRARAKALILLQLRQGATPHRLALSLAVAFTLALLPVIGTTTVLCIAAGAALRLNHALMQVVNYALSPLQLLLLIPFWKAGGWLGAPHLALSLPELRARLDAGLMQAIGDFGWIMLGGVGAWAATAPLVLLLCYLLSRPLFGLLARRRAVLLEAGAA